jgi:hypothetical protein
MAESKGFKNPRIWVSLAIIAPTVVLYFNTPTEGLKVFGVDVPIIIIAGVVGFGIWQFFEKFVDKSDLKPVDRGVVPNQQFNPPGLQSWDMERNEYGDFVPKRTYNIPAQGRRGPPNYGP